MHDNKKMAKNNTRKLQVKDTHVSKLLVDFLLFEKGNLK